MRTIIYLLLLVSFIGCKKENPSELQLTGVWLFKESRYSSGYLPNIVKANPVYPVSLAFKGNGTFSITKLPYITSLQVKLQEFDRYQALPDNEVRFYNTTNGEEITYKFVLDQELEIYHPGCREGCSDFFVRSY